MLPPALGHQHPTAAKYESWPHNVYQCVRQCAPEHQSAKAWRTALLVQISRAVIPVDAHSPLVTTERERECPDHPAVILEWIGCMTYSIIYGVLGINNLRMDALIVLSLFYSWGNSL